MPLFARHGLVVTRATHQPVYGGALRITVRPTGAPPERGDGAATARSTPSCAASAAAGLEDPAFLASLAGRVADLCAAVRPTSSRRLPAAGRSSATAPRPAR